MKVRLATPKDLDEILAIYDRARDFMRQNGNPIQWGDSYPEKELICSDLNGGHLYLLTDKKNAIAGVFSCFPEGEPDYDNINGKWLNDLPYTAIHRVASAGTHKGIFSHILSFCRTFSSNIKIDTHLDNLIMQSVLKKHGFVYCGTVITDNIELLAFQFTEN